MHFTEKLGVATSPFCLQPALEFLKPQTERSKLHEIFGLGRVSQKLVASLRVKRKLVNVSGGAEAGVSFPWLIFAFPWATYFIWPVYLRNSSEHVGQ